MTHMYVKFHGMSQMLAFVNLMNQFDCEADIKSGHILVDAKSILGVVNIAQNKAVELILHTSDALTGAMAQQLAEFAA